MILYTLKNWIEVLRLQTAFVTCLALYLGYVSVDSMTLSSLFLLTVLGFLVHSWGFGQNNYYDYEYDKNDIAKSDTPLVKGTIRKDRLYYITWLSIMSAHLLTLFISPEAFLILSVSTVCGWYYNTHSKVNVISEISLAMWGLLIVILGAVIAGSINTTSYIFGIVIAIQLFAQIQEGSIKDIAGPEHTFAERLGVRCIGEDDIMEYSPIFRNTISLLKVTELALVSYIVYDIASPESMLDIIVLVLFIMSTIIFITTSTLYLTARLDRDKIKKRSSIHEISAILMIGVSTHWLDYKYSLFIAIAPIVWYLLVNKILHTGTLNPDV